MKYQERKKAVLLLSDGLFFEGYSIGKIGTTTGELCFNTGMTGYQEVFTDPSYFGQLMVTTHTHIGNYGVFEGEAESDSVKISGLVVKNYSWTHSRFDADGGLQEYLTDNNIVGISDIDTRKLVRHIRHKGAMNGIISSEIFDKAELEKHLAECPSMEGLELASKVTCAEPYTFGDEGATYRIAALDFGIKSNILRCLAERDCFVKVFPAQTTASELEAFHPHGYFLSNGPGDPAAMPYAIDTVKELLEKDTPIFGICMGHQILCSAVGLKTYKMHHGHRGINHPVKNLIKGTSEVTSQNHGFAVSMDDAESHDRVEVTHVNLNDHSLEGIRILDRKAFSVQHHPEAGPGPHDSRYLFDDFVAMMAAEPVTA